MAADHKENEGEIINYCIFLSLSPKMQLSPAQKSTDGIESTIEQHFNRRRRQDKIILGSAFFDRNELLNEHNILLLTS